MPLIPKNDATTDETVSQAKEALAAKEAIEAKMKTRLEGVEAAIDAQTTNAGDASAAIYLAEAGGASEKELDRLREVAAEQIEKLDALKKEREALSRAVEIAAGNTSTARLAVARISHRNHVNRVNRILEKALGTTIKLENALQDAVDQYRALLGHADTLKNIWPGGELPVLPIMTSTGITTAVEQFLFKIGTTIDPIVNVPTIKFPGGKCYDMTLLGMPDKLPSISGQLTEASQFYRRVLLGEVDGRTGQSLAPTEPAVNAATAA